MAILVAVVIGILVGFLRRGKLRGLVDYMKSPILLVLSFLIEASLGLLVTKFPNLFPQYLWVVVVVQYALIFAFFIINCRKWPIAIMAVGVLMNFAVIISNGGSMPVAEVVADIPAYADTVQRISEGLMPEYFIMHHKVAFWYFGDVILIPGGNGFASIGDIVLCIGMVFYIICGMGKTTAKRAKRRAHDRGMA